MLSVGDISVATLLHRATLGNRHIFYNFNPEKSLTYQLLVKVSFFDFIYCDVNVITLFVRDYLNTCICDI